MSKSSKQKLNTKSSTEAELVGASDYLPYPIWAKKFLEAQGYELAENIFYQDNQSTMRFEKNGRKSCGPNSRHIDIRYFFIKDRIDIEGIDVQYCPTGQMLADFFTKPLQGSLFEEISRSDIGPQTYQIVEGNNDGPIPGACWTKRHVGRNWEWGRRTKNRPANDARTSKHHLCGHC